MRSSLGAVGFSKGFELGFVGRCCCPLQAPPFRPFPHRRAPPPPSIQRYPPLMPRKRLNPHQYHFHCYPQFPTQARHSQVMSPHTPDGAPPLAVPAPWRAPAPAERQSEKGVCAQRSWWPRTWCYQTPDENRGREVPQREEPHGVSPLFTISHCSISLSVGSLPLHLSLPPPLPTPPALSAFFFPPSF